MLQVGGEKSHSHSQLQDSVELVRKIDASCRPERERFLKRIEKELSKVNAFYLKKLKELGM